MTTRPDHRSGVLADVLDAEDLLAYLPREERRCS